MPIILSIISNPFKSLCLVLLTISSYLYIDNLKLEKDNSILKFNQITLNESIDAQKLLIDVLKSSIENTNSSLEDLVSSNNEANYKLSDSLKEISELRSMESRRSYENPYERGNFSTNMLSKRLQSISGKADTSTN